MRPKHCTIHNTILAITAILLSVIIPAGVPASVTNTTIIKNKEHSRYNKWAALSIPELSAIGDRYINNPDSMPKAIKAYTAVVGQYEGGGVKDENLRDVVLAMNDLGYIYTFHYLDYQKGIKYLTQSLELAESKEITDVIPVICLNLGAIYSFNHLYFSGISFLNKTINIYAKGLETALEVKDWNNYLKIINNIIDISIALDRPVSEEIIEKFRESSNESRENFMYPFTGRHVKAYEALEKGDYDKAITIYSEMERMTSGFQDSARYQLMAMYEKAQVYERQKDYPTAISEILRGLEITQRNNYDDVTVSFYDDARRLYLKSGDDENAERYYVLYLKQRDLILDTYSMRAVNEYDFLNEMEKVEDTVRDLSYNKKIQNTWLWVLGIFSTLAVAFVIYYIYSNRELRQRNQSLYRKNLINIETEGRNFELKKENDELRAKLSASVKKENDDKTENNAEAPDKRGKYSYSQLDENRKENIRKKIETVIEEDRDVFSQEFSLGMLADKVGCPQTYLSQVISEKIGKNFYTILSERRIKEACRIMSDPANRHLSIEGIATEVGIRSRSNFTTLFKKFTGLTPGEFARQTASE